MDNVLSEEDKVAIEAELSLIESLRVLKDQIDLLQDTVNHIQYKNTSQQMQLYRVAFNETLVNVSNISQKASECFKALCFLYGNQIP